MEIPGSSLNWKQIVPKFLFEILQEKFCWNDSSSRITLRCRPGLLDLLEASASLGKFKL